MYARKVHVHVSTALFIKLCLRCKTFESKFSRHVKTLHAPLCYPKFCLEYIVFYIIKKRKKDCIYCYIGTGCFIIPSQINVYDMGQYKIN